MNHLKIKKDNFIKKDANFFFKYQNLRCQKVDKNDFKTEDPKIMGAALNGIFTTAIRHSRFVHPCYEE